MLTFYFIFLIIGGALLGISLLTGTDSDFADDASHFDFDGDNSDVTIHDSPELYQDGSVNDSADAIKLFSFRNLVYFAAFFGLTGTILTLMHSSTIISLISSLSLGAFSFIFGHKLMKYLKATETGQGINLKSLVGKQGFVSLPMKRGTFGKIILEQGGQTIELKAEIADVAESDSFKSHENVIIISINNNIAQIIDSNFS